MGEKEERFVKIDGKIIYESDVKMMSVDEITQLLKECTNAIQEIAIKKSVYKASNKEPINSKKFLKQLNQYKIASIKLQQGVVWINELKKQKACEKHLDREHWFFCFYREALNSLPKRTFNKLRERTVERTGEDLEVEI